MERCYSLGEAYDENDASARGFIVNVIGNIVELHINARYSEWKIANLRSCVPYPAPFATDFFDALDDSCGSLAGFLRVKHPQVDATAAEQWCRTRKQRDGDRSLVPDILSNDGGIQEFYEIKARSDSSLESGRRKIRNFVEMMAGLQVHPQYEQGYRYSPNERTLVYSGTWAAVPVRWYLRWERVEGPLIAYQFCCEITAASVNEAAAILCLRFVLLMLVLGRHPSLAAAAARAMASLRSPLIQSVGDGGSNATADVTYVQLLLNDWRARHGLSPIPVNALSDTQLHDAIHAFHAATFETAERVLHPDSDAMRTLESSHLEGGRAEVSVDLQFAATFAGIVDLAAVILRGPEGAMLDPEITAAAALQDYLERMHDEAVAIQH